MDVRKLNLYDIDNQMREIFDAAEIDEETGEFQCDISKLTELEGLEDAKIESLALYIKELEASAVGILPEANRLYAIGKQYEKKANFFRGYLERYLAHYFEKRGVSKFQGKFVSVGYHHSKETQIIDEAKAFESANSIGAVTAETKYNFDKKALKKYILAHKDEGLAGISVVDKRSLKIL